jgi:hypothetical protein
MNVRHAEPTYREHLMRDHRRLAIVPFPYHKRDKHQQSDNHCAQHIRTGPWMAIPTRLHGDKKQRQSHDAEEASQIVDLLQHTSRCLAFKACL